MTGERDHERATGPDDLGRFFVERTNAGDVEGLVALFTPDAVLALPDGQVATGTEEIRQVLQKLLADRPTLTPGNQQPALRSGDLALTSTRLTSGGATAEVAQRQPDGTWLWAIDQPRIVGAEAHAHAVAPATQRRQEVYERATEPDDLERFWVERANAGDVEGLLPLYTPDAVIALSDGQVATGTEEIRQALQELLADRPTFTADGQQPTLRNGDLALTSSLNNGGGATAEVAQRQADGTWLWAIDNLRIVGG